MSGSVKLAQRVGKSGEVPRARLSMSFGTIPTAVYTTTPCSFCSASSKRTTAELSLELAAVLPSRNRLEYRIFGATCVLCSVILFGSPLCMA